MVSGIEDLLKKQAVSLKQDEASIVRQFKDKLAEVEAEVVAERGRGASASILGRSVKRGDPDRHGGRGLQGGVRKGGSEDLEH